MRNVLTTLTVLTVLYCTGCSNLSLAPELSRATLPSQLFDESLPADSMVTIWSNPDSDLILKTYYPDGTLKLDFFRNRRAVYTVLGEQIAQIERSRTENFGMVTSTAMDFIERGFRFAIANPSLFQKSPNPEPREPSALDSIKVKAMEALTAKLELLLNKADVEP